MACALGIFQLDRGDNKITVENYQKVPKVTFLFWIIKIIATTLGETGGDMLSMSMGLGYLTATAIFGIIFIGSVIIQILTKKFHPFIYWLTIIATTTVGTTMADFVDRSLGIGYLGGSSILLTLLILSLTVWRLTLGTISINTVNTPKVEIFYWITILFSQTLGTALGDWTADSAHLGYNGAGIIFSALLLFIAALYYFTPISRTVLFWSAFILTRPLGAVLGDFLDKPLASGGLNLSRYTISEILLFIFVILIIISQKIENNKKIG